MAVVTVNLNLVATDAPSAIRNLASLLAHAPGVTDVNRLLADVLAREALTPTFLGSGLALPHARTDAVSERVLSVGRCPEGVPFGLGGERAHLVVLIGCPKHEIKAYLDHNRQLLNRLRDPNVRSQLMSTLDPADFPKLLGLEAS